MFTSIIIMPEVTVYHIQQGKLVKVPDPGKFGQGDCYLVDGGLTVYMWIGPKSTADEQFLAAAEAVFRDTARKGQAQLVRIDGGDEPPAFKALFKNFQLTDEDTAGILRKVQLQKHEYKMWRVSNVKGQTFFTEVPWARDSLKSEYVFLLDTWDNIYIWRGKKASAREKFDATIIARKYDAERVGAQRIILVDEGEEPDSIKKLLR
jgi:hypothetical protein